MTRSDCDRPPTGGAAHAARRPREPLGFSLRLVQAFFIGKLLLAWAFAAVCEPSAATYDITMVRAIVLAGSAVVCAWLLQMRSRRARATICVIVVLDAALSVLDSFVHGAYETIAWYLGGAITSGLFVAEYCIAAAIIAYLALSPHAKRVLAHRYHGGPTPGGNTWDTPPLKRIVTWEFWRDLCIYFAVFSFLGHWAEMLFCELIRIGVFMGDYDRGNTMLWDQWLYPFSAEGIAVILIVLLLSPLAHWLLKRFNGRKLPAVALSFIANGIVCTAIDFSTGITANADYHLWDYRNMPFNFMGQICLQNSIVYSLAATLIVWVFYPLTDTAIRRLPKLVVDGAFYSLLGIYGFLALLHFMYLSPTGWVFG